MAYNKAKEEYKWKVWKEQEEKKLRELGVSEEVIAELRDYDWKDKRVERCIGTNIGEWHTKRWKRYSEKYFHKQE